MQLRHYLIKDALICLYFQNRGLSDSKLLFHFVDIRVKGLEGILDWFMILSLHK